MKGSRLQAQSPRRALLWSGGIGPFTRPAQKYSTTKRPLKGTREQCLRHISEVALRKPLPYCITL